MEHLGDIAQIHGDAVPIVDCIIGGSPCQDLSVAGKRAGLAGERSGLFMEQIRITKEMRERDRNARRTDQLIRPRYMVWENVPGAFSSNKGEDFASVLTEIVRIAEPDAPRVPVPCTGWPKWGSLRGVGGRWSVAWRTLDAQYWGVPQRRRRIALVADFGGDSAAEILFVRESVCGNTSPRGAARQGAAGGAESGVGSSVYCLQGNGIDRADTAGCNGRGWKENVSYTLNTIDRPAVCAGFKLGNSEKARSIGYCEEQTPTLNAECGGNKSAVVYSFDSLASNSMKSPNPKSGCREVDTARTLDTTSPDPFKNQDGIAILDMSHASDVIRECGDVAPTLQSRMGTGGNQVPLAYGIGNGQVDEACSMAEETSQTLNTMHDAQAVMCSSVDCRNFREGGELNGTLQAKSNGGVSYNLQNIVRTGMTVRRLTPLECERLQGYPDGWTDIGAWTDSKGKLHKESSDSARYKALGNSIALPPWKWVLKRLCAQYERDATMASLFDGISGFCLIWEQLNGKGSVKWCSEIEEFPIAVTKRRFERRNL